MVNNMILQIVKGLPGVPGDTLTVEHIDEVIDLLGSRNWSVSEQGWIPQMPQVKNDGVYIDNPIIAGKFPIVMTLGDVQETITLVNRGASVASRSWIEQKLFKLARDAEDFWTTDTQNQPVYLVFQPNNGVGPQYARIYTMDIAPQANVMERQNFGKVTITIDREHGWTPIPPGENPKRWSYIAAGTEAANWNTGNAVLVGGSGHIASGTLKNKQEFNTLYTFSTPNYLDIPAASIPGDLPAKALITFKPNSFAYNADVYIANTSKATTITNRASNALPLYNVLPFSAATMQHADGVLTATSGTIAGVVHNPVSANQNYMNVVWTATGVERYLANWAIGGTGMPHLNPHVLRGTYAVYIRVCQVGGSAGQSSVRLECRYGNSNVFHDSGQLTPALNANGPSVLYAGTIILPPVPGTVTSSGTGTQVESSMDFRFYGTRIAGTTATLYCTDIWLMPIEEGHLVLNAVSTWAAGNVIHVIDNTGYILHGKPGVNASLGVGDNLTMVELKGNEILLQPGKNNRIYFMWMDRQYALPTTITSETTDVTVNILPRWAGIRDV